MTLDSLFPIGKAFKPAESFVQWYILDYFLILVFLAFVAFLPAVIGSGLDPLVLGAIVLIVGFVSAFYIAWTRLYYASMEYELRHDEITWKRGVWFRRTGIVPYNRITNLDLVQGPVMRYLGISSLAIQTAGYSGQAVSEIRIEAIEKAEELREIIRSQVRRSARSDDGTGNAPATTASQIAGNDERIVTELVAIRKLLEEKKG